MRIASQLNQRNSQAPQAGSVPDDGRIRNALAPQKSTPLINGGKAVLNAVNNAVDGAMAEMQNAEKDSDIIAGQAKWNQLEQKTLEEIQNLPASDKDSAIVSEDILKRMNSEYDAWMSGISGKGIKNVRYDDSRAALRSFQEERKEQVRTHVKGVLAERKRNETFNRFDIGITEAIRTSGNTAEQEIRTITQLMEEHGVDPEVTRVKRESSLASVSKTRLQRSLDTISLASESEEPEIINQALDQVASEIDNDDGPFRHFSGDQRLAAHEVVRDTRKNIDRNRQYRELVSAREEEERRSQVEGQLYQAMVIDKNLTPASLDQFLKDEQIDWKTHEKWSSKLLSIEKARGNSGSSSYDPGQIVIFDNALEFAGKLPEGLRTAFVEEFRGKVEESFSNGLISKSDYREYQKVWKSGGKNLSMVGDPATELNLYIQRAKVSGTAGTDEFFERLDQGFIDVLISEEKYNSFTEQGLKARNGKASDALQKSRKELEMYFNEMEALRGDEKNRRKVYFAQYIGPDDRFEDSFDSLIGRGLENAGDEAFGIDLWRQIEFTQQDWVGMTNDLISYVEDNPGVTKEDIDVEMKRLLAPAKLDAARDRYRMISSDSRVERAKAKFQPPSQPDFVYPEFN